MKFGKIVKLLNCYIAGDKKNILTIKKYSNNRFQRGFTLIEIMVVISVTAIIGTLGIAAFSNFNKIQINKSAISEVESTLILARSRAVSQTRLSSAEDSQCAAISKKLEGYSVKVSIDGRTYFLRSHCSNGEIPPIFFPPGTIGDEKNLPEGLTFIWEGAPPPPPPPPPVDCFFFPVLNGTSDPVDDCQTEGEIVISNSEIKSERIIISDLGGIRRE